MRRGLASLIMVLSLLIGSGSWAGFILTRTALDPGRSEALADNLLDNTVVRGVIVGRLADAVEAQIPASLPIPRQTIELAADEALDDPRVEAIVRDGFVRAHQNALNGVDTPVTLDATALGQVGREKAVELRPELDAVLPAAPRLDVELPTGGLSVFGRVRDTVQRYTLIGAVIALTGVIVAFVVSNRRAKVLRRLAYWAFANSAFWLIMGFGVPELLGRVAPSSMSIASAVVDVFFGAMIRPALIMAGAGLALLALSLAWPALARRRPAAMVDRAAPGALHQPRPILEGFAGQGQHAPPVQTYQPPQAPLYQQPVYQEPVYQPPLSQPGFYDPNPETVRMPDQSGQAPGAATYYQPPTPPVADPYGGAGTPPIPPADGYTVPADPYSGATVPAPGAYGGHAPSASGGHAPSASGGHAAPPEPTRRPEDPETWTIEDHEAPTRVWSLNDESANDRSGGEQG